jgi:GNAT superfamily N-acetyltransferase
LTPVPPESREALRALFSDYPGLHGVIDSVLEGYLGEAYADDPADPRVAHLVLDFNLLAGDANAPSAAPLLKSLSAGEHIAAAVGWDDLLQETFADRLHPYERFVFSAPERWDRDRLTTRLDSLPEGFTLERIDEGNVGEFAELADSLIYNFQSPADFLARGVGFGVQCVERSGFVAGCSSFAISSRSLEFEIQTHPDFQRRGLALVTGSRMIEHCLDNGLEPCWDAAHEGSALLAEHLGFTGRSRYTAYRLS